MAPSTIGPATITTAGIDGATRLTHQRKAFYANGRHWVFFVYNDAGTRRMAYSSSVAGSSYDAPTNIRTATEGDEFSVSLEVSGATYYVHYGWSDNAGGSAIMYRRGALGSGGVITWSAEQTALAAEVGYEFENITICQDYSGFVYIAYTKRKIDGTETTIYVIQSITSPTWTASPSNPQQITAIHDPSWIPVIVPFGMEVMVIYSGDNGNIYIRVYAGAMWGMQIDSGFDMGSDARRISVSSERFFGASPVNVHMVWQDANEDILHASYDLAWSASHSVYASTENLSPMLAALWYGDDDTVDHPAPTLYCFWTPIAAAPTADWVHYKVSRDAGVTWTDEAGANAVEEWIDETVNDFDNHNIGSVAYRSVPNNTNTKSYLTIVYTNDGPYVRGAGLEFTDPDEELAAEFVVRPFVAVELLGEFVVRQSSPADVGAPDLLAIFNVARYDANLELLAIFDVDQDNANVELLGIFNVRPQGSAELLGALNVQQAGSQELLGVFAVSRSDSEELLAEFVVTQPDSGEVFARFIVSMDAWIVQGVPVETYRALGVIS